METYTLQRTGLPPLSFQGLLLAESVGEDSDGTTQGRTHSIAVYETDDGEFVVSVRFQSPFTSELSDNIVEAVSTKDEVEEVLSLYDATERLDAKLFDDDPTKRGRQRVAAALQQRFDRQVLSVLKASVARESVA
ncbi:MAG: hypothetical protein R3C59_28505 [Planctomycetaceae bacterium]